MAQLIYLAYELLIVIFLFLCVKNLFSKDAPFVPVPRAVVSDIVQALAVRPGDIVWDLGCGDARILTAAAKQEPHAHYFGVDKDLFALLFARIRILFSREGAHIRVRYGDFFATDVSQATRVFLFLFPEVMDALLPHLEKNLPHGARVVSCDFAFSRKNPAHTISLPRASGSLGKTLYIYEF